MLLLLLLPTPRHCYCCCPCCTAAAAGTAHTTLPLLLVLPVLCHCWCCPCHTATAAAHAALLLLLVLPTPRCHYCWCCLCYAAAGAAHATLLLLPVLHRCCYCLCHAAAADATVVVGHHGLSSWSIAVVHHHRGCGSLSCVMLPIVGAAPSMAKGTTSVEPTSGAEKAPTARPKALEPRTYGLREGGRLPALAMDDGSGHGRVPVLCQCGALTATVHNVSSPTGDHAQSLWSENCGGSQPYASKRQK